MLCNSVRSLFIRETKPESFVKPFLLSDLKECFLNPYFVFTNEHIRLLGPCYDAVKLGYRPEDWSGTLLDYAGMWLPKNIHDKLWVIRNLAMKFLLPNPYRLHSSIEDILNPSTKEVSDYMEYAALLYYRMGTEYDRERNIIEYLLFMANKPRGEDYQSNLEVVTRSVMDYVYALRVRLEENKKGLVL